MKERLINEISKDEWMMGILRSVRDLKLPDCWVGAGFIRNKAWDFLHGYSERTPLSDIDVVFLDRINTSQDYENEVKEKLKLVHPQINFEVINQARTHLWHNRGIYQSTEEAISEWVETATCIAARLTIEEEIQIIAPHGLEDLERLILRPVPSLKDINIFNERIKRKVWLEKWPKLKITLQKYYTHP